LTSYDQELNEKDRALRDWLDGDAEAKELVSKFQKVIVTNNSLNKFADIEMRQNYLNEIISFINTCESTFGSATATFLEKMKFLIEIYFRWCYDTTKARAKDALKVLLETEVASCGNCPICFEDINSNQLLLTPCGHSFHMRPVGASWLERPVPLVFPCPICKPQSPLLAK
jgi:Ring finger domain